MFMGDPFLTIIKFLKFL
ncbi:hypothetical protein [Plasmodium yoelii yoelii]|uniref:Uncharacterized protein n=1 Tax=Plasmodium yoelii yoelii TaxID=73239 RepID=Q7RBC2_PLAYO|nr:hypothetical protein [Plasmodium yoelii yoelii]